MLSTPLLVLPHSGQEPVTLLGSSTHGLAGPLTSVCEHVPLEGASPREDAGAVGTVDLLQAVGVGVPLCPQQLVFWRAALLFITGSILVSGGTGHVILSIIILCGLQKWTELVGVRCGQHLLDAGKLATRIQVYSTTVGTGPTPQSLFPAPLL